MLQPTCMLYVCSGQATQVKGMSCTIQVNAAAGRLLATLLDAAMLDCVMGTPGGALQSAQACSSCAAFPLAGLAGTLQYGSRA